MRLRFLGTGSAMPTPDRHQTGLLFEGGDEPLLVDCGAGVLHRLAGTDVGYEGVSTVLLTHHHLDHVSDLMALLKARWLAGEETLTVAGPAGTPDLVEGLLDVHDYLRGRVELDLRTVSPGEFSLAGYDLAARETRHSMDCLAYRITAGDGATRPAGDATGDADAEGNDARTDREERPAPTVTVSGDTEAFPELIAFADGSAVLVHDCSFPDGVEVDNHPTPTSLGRALAAADAAIGRVYLTHRYPHTDGHEEAMLASVREQYDGQVRHATDRQTITVR